MVGWMDGEEGREKESKRGTEEEGKDRRGREDEKEGEGRK